MNNEAIRNASTFPPSGPRTFVIGDVWNNGADVEFRETFLSDAGGLHAIKALRDPSVAVKFGSTRKVARLGGGTYVIAYGSAQERADSTVAFLQAKALDWPGAPAHVPEPRGEFELDGQCCLIVDYGGPMAFPDDSWWDFAAEGVVFEPLLLIAYAASPEGRLQMQTKIKTDTLLSGTAPRP